MAHSLRIETPGVYHVTCRGNNKRLIVLDDYDRLTFFFRLGLVARKHGWKIYAYCLMDNHYHLVIEIDERGMSRGFCQLNTAYALAFNGRHGRINHLFGRRYWSGGLTDDRTFLNTCAYVLRNPPRAGIAESVDDYEWSSYRATVGTALAHVPLAGDELLGWFSQSKPAAVTQFVDFVAGPLSEEHVRRQPTSREVRAEVT